MYVLTDSSVFFRTSALKSKILSLGDTSIFHQQTLQPMTCSSAYQKFLRMRNTVGHVINYRTRMRYKNVKKSDAKPLVGVYGQNSVKYR